MPFSEEQFNTAISQGSSYGIEYNESIFEGHQSRYGIQHSPFPKVTFSVDLNDRSTEEQVTGILELYKRCGILDGFRFPHPEEFSSKDSTGTPTTIDQYCTPINEAAGTYQLMQWFGDYQDDGCRRREILKPRAGTVVASKDGADLTITTHFTVDSTTGILTLVTPDVGAVVKAGFYFDIPMVFSDHMSGINLNNYNNSSVRVDFEEMLNL